jgi:hypothetical protein
MFRKEKILPAAGCLLTLCLLSFPAHAAERPPLQGEVNAADAAPAPSSPTLTPGIAMPAPVVTKPLQGKAEEQALQGSASDQDDSLRGMKPQSDKSRVLRANASMDDDIGRPLDPDMDDQEMMVEWDRWRNRFLNAVQQGLQEQLESTGDNLIFIDPRTGRQRSKYPPGISATFFARITPDRRVVVLKLLQGSGFDDFDRSLLEAVKSLEGTSILRYPRGSRRQIVTQAAGITLSTTGGGPANFHFGDTERYRVAP